MTRQTQAAPVAQVHSYRRGPITTTALVRYAGASGDFNRIHFDLPFATAAGLRTVVAHGMLTMAFAASCATEAAGPGAFVTGISARFLAPVWVGDVVDVTATSTRGTAGETVLELEARVGDTVVLKGTATAVQVRSAA